MKDCEEVEFLSMSDFIYIKTNHKCFVEAVQVIGICGSIRVLPIVF